jgi:hypothetical protein
MDGGPFARRLELHQEVGALQAAAPGVVHEMPKDGGGQRERDVPERAPPFGGQRHRQEVTGNDLDVRGWGQISAKPFGKLGIDLDGGHASCGLRERPGQSSPTGSDLDDVIVSRDVSIANQLRGDRWAAEEVLVVRRTTGPR